MKKAHSAETPRPAISRQEEMPDWAQTFYPQFGSILDNGNLNIKCNGILENPDPDSPLSGERVSGAVTVSPQFPLYEEWKTIIQKAARNERKAQRRAG